MIFGDGTKDITFVQDGAFAHYIYNCTEESGGQYVEVNCHDNKVSLEGKFKFADGVDRDHDGMYRLYKFTGTITDDYSRTTGMTREDDHPLAGVYVDFVYTDKNSKLVHYVATTGEDGKFEVFGDTEQICGTTSVDGNTPYCGLTGMLNLTKQGYWVAEEDEPLQNISPITGDFDVTIRMSNRMLIDGI